jgi:hypothetical protein
VVTDCAFIGNTASFVGGGMLNVLSSDAKVTNSTFWDNSAEEGGGMYTDMSGPTVINCTFCSNFAQVHGGAMFNDDANSLTVTNCILWNDTPDEIKNDYGTTPTVTYSCIMGGYWGTGNIDLNPRFVDEANGDFHLTYPSGCRNAGDNSVVTEPGDFEGDPRIAFGTVDMGVDEFYQHLYVTGDFSPGGAIQGKFVGLPGTSPVGLFMGSGVLDPPLPTAWGDFYLKAPWFLFPLIPIPGDGVLIIPAVIPNYPPAPYDLPMQALIGLEADSLTNLFVMEVR